MVAIFLISLITSFIFLPYFIKLMTIINVDGQPIRSFCLQDHFITKKGTPTMGGIIILASVLCSILFYVALNIKVLLLLFIITSFAVIGFLDDYYKLTVKSYHGLSGKVKILIQFFVAAVSVLILKSYSESNFTHVYLLNGFTIDLSYLYIPFAAFIIVGAANAVNLTDGLDSLAATQSITSFASLGLSAYLVQADVNIILSCIAFIGAILSFLWFNAHPAKIFMGDVGSLSIGAALGFISILIKREILLAMIGGIFVMETLSVIIQFIYFRYTKGKRIFLMSPIHHHFEKKGWSETTIVIRFWVIAVVLSVLAIAFFL
ncbi:phospho-N-acetylmuramoyl-pentapeptide-transferase [Wolbachia pipientis]|uniref:Phospho-N-acetylmuramoyl-pentapeptide-transferase n=1 Tax=Wolbachia pipientis TaxID=955 RepID=A0A1E7QK71_WOLPI|nr:phospho-N-acetylmuramoyl-pentapeptide-transferase [Wolbachia pipientis]OEY86614.1 phospho-N-acetylmuramoyl-pentapeptide-transferase [Wolbachia pipientis]